jgi:DNA invertase Pin-like site-specific DNA recombinase
MGKKVALYLRISTDMQIKGLQSQESALREYCKNHNLTNIKVYKDITGKSTKFIKAACCKPLLQLSLKLDDF